mmetsp:Transcript_8031/g.22469  ORF Transcript_8031/g.22469 Transcript_8031/m.22469 type:complete len:93 (-) Transcript_8031:812-1090(-)
MIMPKFGLQDVLISLNLSSSTSLKLTIVGTTLYTWWKEMGLSMKDQSLIIFEMEVDKDFTQKHFWPKCFSTTQFPLKQSQFAFGEFELKEFC